MEVSIVLEDLQLKEHYLLCLFAAAGEEVKYDQLTQHLYRFPGLEEPFSDAYELRSILQQLVVSKLLQKSGLQVYVINPEYHVELLRYYAHQRYFSHVAHLCQLMFPNQPWYWSFRGKDASSLNRMERDLGLHFLLGNLNHFNHTLQWYINESEHDVVLDTVFRLFAEPTLQVDLLANYEPEFQQYVVNLLLEHHMFEMEPLGPLIELALSLIPIQKGTSHWEKMCSLLSVAMFLTGEIVDQERTKLLEQHTLSHSFLRDFAKGDFKRNIAYIEASRKTKRKDQIWLYGFPIDLMYLLALAAQPQVLLHEMKAIYLQFKKVSNRGEKLSHYEAVISALVLYFQGQIKESKQTLKNAALPDHPVTILLSTIVQSWLFPDAMSKSLIRQYIKLADSSGYDFLAFHLTDALSHASKNTQQKESAQELYSGKEFQSYFDLFRHYEEWELALVALQSEAIKVSKKQRMGEEQRVAWAVDFEKMTFTPKLQKIKKNGAWSKGRNIAQYRLLEQEVPVATEQDLRIAKTLYAPDEMRNSYKVSTKTLKKDSSNSEQLLLAMVNHPNLFLEKSGSACDLSYGEVELLVQPDENNQFQISLSMPLDKVSKTGWKLVRLTPTRYKLVEITDTLLNVSKIVGDRIQIPKEAEASLTESLHNIKHVVQVSSPLTENVEEMQTVPYDQRIYVHLLPVGDGFHVELFIKPMQEVELYFQPGKGGKWAYGTNANGEKVSTTRNLKAEKIAAAKVIADVGVLKKNKPVKKVWELENAEDCLQLLLDLEPLKADDRIVVEWPKGEKLKIAHVGHWDKFRLNVSGVNNWFELKGELQLDESLVFNMQELVRKMNQSKNGFIALGDGEFLALTEQFRKQVRDLERFSDMKSNSWKLHPLALSMLDDMSHMMAEFEADIAWKEQLNKLTELQDRHFPVPDGFCGTLRNYQLEGYQWLRRLAHWGVGGCLADDMGLGKTIQMLALLLARKDQGPALVVAPASVCRNWKRESLKFTPDLCPRFYNDEGRQVLLKDAKPGDLIIATYGLMQQDIEAFESVEFATVVLDEAQAIKNYSAKRTKAAMQLNAACRFVTTGTPIENHLGELWTLFHFINPGLLGSAEQFQKKYAQPIERYRDEDTRESLRKLVQPFVLRRHKSEVLKELPEKTEVQLDIDLSQEEMAFYEALRRQALERIEASDAPPGQNHLQILAEITRMRQACCHPKMVSKSTSIASSKLSALGELLDELIENDHKVLIFSQFVKFLKIIRSFLDQKKISYQYLDGSTPIKKRQEYIDAFQAGDGDVFLISLKAGGTGLNLTAADYVIHMDPWWNPAVEDQASDRAHRIGQTRPVTVYRMVTNNTIEGKIMSLHEQKRNLADSLLSGSDVSGKLSAEELMKLIRQS